MSDEKKPLTPRERVLQQMAERGQDWNAINDATRESSRVDFLLKRLKLSSKAAYMAKWAERETGSRYLTLSRFAQLVVNFPIYMGYAPAPNSNKLHVNKKASLAALFRSFREAPFVDAYADFYEQNVDRANGKTLGLLFPYKGVVQGLILYEGNGLDAYWTHGLDLVYSSGTSDNPRHLHVKPFASVVDAIVARGSGWTPDLAQ